MTLAYCSDGTRISESNIKQRLRKSYSDTDDGTTHCRGCGKQYQCRAHIVAKARCKTLHKTELIWNPINYFKSCYACNSLFESYKNPAIKEMNNYDQCLSVLKEHDPEMYLKHTL